MNEFDDLLEKFSNLKFHESNTPTFLEILSKRDAETLWSKMLCFFLNPNKEHGLNDFILKSFLNVCEFDFSYSIQSIETITEYEFIDIVIISNNFIIGIENKVNASLYNDLNEYKLRLNNLAEKKGIKNVYLVVLSKFHLNKSELSKNNTEPFKNITYSLLISEFHKQFSNFYKTANTKYLIFLLDFINNIEKSINMPTIINNVTNLKFIRDNNSKIQELISITNQFREELGAIAVGAARKINYQIESGLKEARSIIKIKTARPNYDYEDRIWYSSADLFHINNDKKKLCRVHFDLRIFEDPFWSFYAYDEGNGHVINLQIDNIDLLKKYEQIKNSLNEDEISDYFIKFLIETTKKIVD